MAINLTRLEENLQEETFDGSVLRESAAGNMGPVSQRKHVDIEVPMASPQCTLSWNKIIL